MLKKVFGIVVALLLTASPAMAEGFYGGVGFGLVNIEDEEAGESFKDSPFGWRILAGYDFNDNFAIEGSYIQSGKAEDTVFGENVEVELSAFTFSAVGLMPLSDSTQLFGKKQHFPNVDDTYLLFSCHQDANN